MTKFKMKPTYIGYLIFAASVIFLAFSVFIGSSSGESFGKIAGTVVGTVEAAKDAQNAYINGKEEGLSAEDTKAYITNSFENVGNLEVLASSVTLTNVNSVGEDYKALYLLKGDAIFSVDLSNTQFTIDTNNNKVIVYAEKPVVDIYINDMQTQKLATYQKNGWTGTSEEGYTQYMNSMKNAESEIREKVADYDALVESAISAEKQQIQFLVQSICGGVDVYVEFKE